MRRIDLLGVDEVPPGTMKMAWVDGTDQVLVVNSNGDLRAVQGICSHEYFELDKGFLTAGTLTCALHLSRFDLESRGIPPDEARKFIVLGFLEPVVARVPVEAERDRLRELLEAKWAAGLEGAAAA